MSDTPRIVPMALIDALREIARTSSDPGARAIANATLVAAGFERVTTRRDVRSTPNEMRRQVMYELRNYRIRATVRDTGEVIEGMTRWDGISSIYAIEATDGEIRYVSVLDKIEKEEVCADCGQPDHVHDRSYPCVWR